MKRALPTAVVLVIVLVPGLLVGAEDETVLFRFGIHAWDEVHEWHGPRPAFGEVPGPHVDLQPGGEPYWTCWSMPQDWEPYDKLVVELGEFEGTKRVRLAVSDDDEHSVGIEVGLVGERMKVEIPVKQLFEAGLQTQHVRGVAFFAGKTPATVKIIRMSLVGKGKDLSTCVRHGVRMLTDAERRDANFYWSYSHWAKRVAASSEHPASGKRSFEMKFSGKSLVSGWGRFAHDWRGYHTLACDVYNPKDKPVTLTVELKDTWVKLLSNAYVAKRDFTLAPAKMTVVSCPLANLEGTSGSAGVGKLNKRYIQQMIFRADEASRPVNLYVDNIRLVGKPGQAFAGQIPAEEIPKFGFEHASDKLKLPVDFHRISIPGAAGGVSRLKVGAARVKITPEVGTRMASVASRSEGILDDVYVRALVLQEQGRDTVAWLHIDNLYAPGRNEVPPVLQERFGIKPENIYWSATHNHNCGAPWASKVFNNAICDAHVKAVETAIAAMKPVKVGLAKTNAKFNFNRVMKGPDGNVYGMLDAKYMGFLMDSRPTDTELAM
ncbi:MAG: hypothetical protein AMS16_03575, partial [Planctomycetes bacterium DG_58]